MTNIKLSKTLKEMILALEPLSYYFRMKPEEFWNCEYKYINTFIQTNMIKLLDDFKMQIILQEAVTDKLIRADSMSKRPRVIPLKKMFKKLFQEEPKIHYQSPQEQIARLRKLK